MPLTEGSYLTELLSFLTPENPAAFVIVTSLQFIFLVWLGGLIVSARRHSSTKRQLLQLQDVDPLVKARQNYTISSAEEKETNKDDIFDVFIHQNKLKQLAQPIVTHLKSIFLAGWSEGRLETGELLRHTSQRLFRWSYVLRTILAIFIVIGLLGTLFGLANSLAELTPIMQNKAADTTTGNEAIVTGLSRLLLELKSAFAPSIWGVALTIVGIILHSFYMRFFAMPMQHTLERLTLTVWIPRLYPTRPQQIHEAMEKSFEAAKRVASFAEHVESKTEKFDQNLDKANAMAVFYSDAAAKLDHAAETIDNKFAERLEHFSVDFISSISKLSSFQEEIKSLYEQLKEGSEEFRHIYGETLDKQNTSLESITTSLKSYEEAYIEERGKIDAKMKSFLDEATEASTSISSNNRKLTEELTEKVVQGLADIEVALRVQLTAIQDKFRGMHEPFDKTAQKIEGTFENFDKDIRTIIHDDIIKHFKDQNEQNKAQLDSIQDLNTKIVDLLRHLSKSNEAEEKQLINLNSSILSLSNAIRTFAGPLTSLSGELKVAIRQLKRQKAVPSSRPSYQPHEPAYSPPESGIKGFLKGTWSKISHLPEKLSRRKRKSWLWKEQRIDTPQPQLEPKAWPEAMENNLDETPIDTAVKKQHSTENDNAPLVAEVQEVESTEDVHESAIESDSEKKNATEVTESTSMNPGVKGEGSTNDPQKSLIETLVESYNTAVHKKEKRGDFRKRYRLTSIGITNSQARTHDDKIAPVFGRVPRGQFYVVEIEENGQKIFAVIPHFSSVFSEKKYHRGGLGYVFQCSDFEQGKKGKIILLKKPAIFRPGQEGHIWHLVEKGEIGIES